MNTPATSVPVVPPPSERDKTMAEQCRTCPLCRHARWRQRGLAFWMVRHVEGGLCPYCRAYERVYGRKAHEPA